ncbi:hypothetical protein BHM03_00026041 [Ensete ventricosum]|nr:hypothetical protein BHM03_00026041 [Ensete ventricosum]
MKTQNYFLFQEEEGEESVTCEGVVMGSDGLVHLDKLFAYGGIDGDLTAEDLHLLVRHHLHAENPFSDPFPFSSCFSSSSSSPFPYIIVPLIITTTARSLFPLHSWRHLHQNPGFQHHISLSIRSLPRQDPTFLGSEAYPRITLLLFAQKKQEAATWSSQETPEQEKKERTSRPGADSCALSLVPTPLFR